MVQEDLKMAQDDAKMGPILLLDIVAFCPSGPRWQQDDLKMAQDDGKMDLRLFLEVVDSCPNGPLDGARLLQDGK